MVKDINSGTGSSNPRRFINFNGTLLFVANTDELWKSDGTEQGTVYVTDLAGTLGDWTVFNSAVYFSVPGGLWKTDGTESGTQLVKEMSASGLTVAGSTLFMRGNVDGSNYGLWKSDGTGSGTVLVKESVHVGDLTNAGGTLYFAGRAPNDSTYGIELWKSDGTASGTVRLSNLNVDLPGQSGTEGDAVLLPRFTYVSATSTLYFFAWYKTELMTYGESRLCSINTSTGTITVYEGEVDTGWLVFIPDEEENGYLYFVNSDWELARSVL